MDFRGIILVALWVLLSGPMLSPPGGETTDSRDRLMAGPGLKAGLTPKPSPFVAPRN